MNIIDFLEQNKDILSISAIESKAGVTASTIKKALSGDRPMSSDNAKKVLDYLRPKIGTHLTMINQKPKGNDVVDITHYDLIAPKTYAHKKTGEIFNIQYQDGAFRFI